MTHLRPDFPRPRLRVKRCYYLEWFELRVVLGREPTLFVLVGHWSLQLWVGHSDACDCSRCIPF